MRPVYESARDLSEERRIANVAAKRWNVSVLKLAKFDCFDWAAYRQHVEYQTSGDVCRPIGRPAKEVLSFVEVKRRYCKFDTYPNIILSLAKAERALWRSEATKLPAIFLVGFDDCIAFAQVTRGQMSQITIEKRADRNDPMDEEPCIHIPMRDFKLLIKGE